jgi:2-polyprenyl-3-methyl-5-hydroxy-6-metoxy-1,4-benzoquinol methylase
MTTDDKPYLEHLYQEIAPGYYDQVHRRGRGAQWFWHDRRFQVVADWLPAECGRILDLGCGPGTFLGHLRPRFRSGLGLDLAVPQIEYARRQYGGDGLRFEAVDLRQFAGRERFDAAVSIEVIEHLPVAETQPFLRAIFDVLEPGAPVVLTTPSYRSLWPLLERLVSWVGPVDYTRQHINPFTTRRLRAELAQAGFEQIETQTFFVISPFAAPLSSRLADRLLGIERALLPGLGSEIAARAVRPAA